MPYVSQEVRNGNHISHLRSIIKGTNIESKGLLEYLITLLLNRYMQSTDENGKTREERYSDLHDAVYAAIHAGEEFKRKRLDPREDGAALKNGVVE